VVWHAPTGAVRASFWRATVDEVPIYICMFLGQAGLEMGFNSAWILATLAPFYFVIRFSVIARQA